MPNRIFCLCLLVFVTFLISANYVEADDSDISISSIRYTNDFENGESITIIDSGRDGGTEYRYAIFDDDDDFPDDWEEVTFDDSEWDMGEAPFGNKPNEGIEPRTIWQSEHTSGSDGNKDYIIVRKNFAIDDASTILGGTIKSAYTNYYAVYLNGEEIEDCLDYSGYCYEGDAEYWNKEIDFNANLFVNGNNTIVLVGRDSLWQGGDNTTWLDAELDIRVQTWKDTPVVLGDELVIRVDFFNEGENDRTNLNVTLEFEDREDAYQTIDIDSNQTYEWRVDWTPSRLGTHNITAKILNNSMTKTIHVGYYAYSIDFANHYETANMDETKQFHFTIKNEGDVNDNFTFYLSGIPNDWEYSFTPFKADLEPGESENVVLNVTTSEDAQAGNYSLYPIVRSQYYSQTTNTVIESGADASTEYTYAIWNASDFPNEYYKTDFDDSEWGVGAAPFGDDEINGIDPNTIWQTDDSNYTYIATRNWFNYTGNLNFSEIQLNVAADNYYRAYLNGELIRDCLSYSWGCYLDGDYWGASITFNTSWLKEGENLLAIAGRDETYQGGNGQQWLDMELETLNLRSSLWGFDEIYEVITLEVNETYDFEIIIPITEKDVEEEEYTFAIWILNRGNVKDSYNITVYLNDTVNFTIVDYNPQLHIPYNQDRDIELKIALTNKVDEFSIGNFNVSITSLNSTVELTKSATVLARMYVIPDTLPPGTYAETSNLVNSSSFEVRWHVHDWYKNNEIMGNDTKYFIIEYMTDSGTNGQNWTEWIVWDNFSSEQSSGIFTYGVDGHKYRFRSIGGDDDGRVEDKENNYDTEILVDLTAPYSVLELRLEGNITNTNYIEIEWAVSLQDGVAEIITGYSAQYRLEGGNWTTFEEDTLAKWAGLNIPVDGIYQFRVITTDNAGNKGISEISRNITVDTNAPNAKLIEIPDFTDSTYIMIEMTDTEGAWNFTLYYYVAREGQEVFPIEWDKYGEYMISELPIEVQVDNQFHYYFKADIYDLANNHFVNESYEDIVVDQDPPMKIRNLEVSGGITIVNSTTDVIVSFMSSQSQDLKEYRIYRSNNQSVKGELIESMQSESLYISYKDLNVELGATYYYTVVAVDRMDFESETETGFINLVIEQEGVEKDDLEEEASFSEFIGPGILVVLAVSAIGAGYYFIGQRAAEEAISAVEVISEGEVSSNFTEADGELLCGSCGAMFEMSDERSCPSCGVFDD